MKVKSLSRVRLFVTPWTTPYQAPLPMGFSKQEYWSGVPLSQLLGKNTSVSTFYFVKYRKCFSTSVHKHMRYSLMTNIFTQFIILSQITFSCFLIFFILKVVLQQFFSHIGGLCDDVQREKIFNFIDIAIWSFKTSNYLKHFSQFQ